MSKPKETHNTAAYPPEPGAVTEVVPAAAEEAPLQEPVPHKEQHKFKLPHLKLATGLLVLAVGINLVGLGANGYLRYRLAALTPKTATTVVIPRATSTASTTAPTVTTLHYVSKALHMEFDYPVDWRIEGTADDKLLSLSSPPFSITGEGNTTNLVRINLTVADPSQEQGSFGFLYDDQLIAMDSEALAYTNPTTIQRKSSNISFEGFGSNTQSTVDPAIIFVSGNLSYKKGQSVGSKNYKSINPHIYAYLDPCGLFAYRCEGPDTKLFTPADWQANANFAKLRTLLASLRFTQ